MSDEDQAAEKTFDPTPKKLEDARKKGDIPKSTDLNTAASYLGLLLALTLAAQFGLGEFVGALAGIFQNADRLSGETFDGGGASLTGLIYSETLHRLAPYFVVPALFVLLSLLGQRAITFAPEKLNFKLSRISPISGAKNKYGANGMFEFAKSAVKLIIVSLILVFFIGKNLDLLIQSVQISKASQVLLIGDLILNFLLMVFAMSLIIGAVDYFWQVAEHTRKNRMSRKDMEDEAKQSEGDPHMKQNRRQKAYEIAMNQMLSDVPGADVVIVNPTHFAVALTWDRSSGGAPVCVAKGVDEIAARIREVAATSAVPIHSDPPTARALFATVEIGQEVQQEHYRAVATAIRFAEDMRKKARGNAQ